ncbi:hypothetical protein ACLOJK_040934 [Asimina triloba]
MSTQFAVVRRSTEQQYGAPSSSPIQPICISFNLPTPPSPAVASGQVARRRRDSDRSSPPPSSTTPASPLPISSAVMSSCSRFASLRHAQIQRPPITSRCLDPAASHNTTHHTPFPPPPATHMHRSQQGGPPRLLRPSTDPSPIKSGR